MKMKVNNYFRIKLCAMVIFALSNVHSFAVDAETEEMRDVKKINIIKEGLASLEVEILRNVSANGQIPLKLSITNIGEKDITYTNWPHLSGFKIRVWNLTGEKQELVPLTKWGKAWMNYNNKNRFRLPGNVTIKPNKKLDLKIMLNRYFDLSWPGQYMMEIEWFGIDLVTKKPVKLFKKSGIKLDIGD